MIFSSGAPNGTIPGLPEYQIGIEWAGGFKPHTPPSYHARSRGRHSPGSGDYWNLWVLGGRVEAHPSGSGSPCILSYEFEDDPGTPSGYWKPGARRLTKWDGKRYLSITCGIINAAGTLGGRWTVEGQVWLFNPTGRQSGPWSGRYQLQMPGRTASTGRIQFPDASESSHQAALQMFVLRANTLWNLPWSGLQSWQTNWWWQVMGATLVPVTPKPDAETEQLTQRIEERDPYLTQVQGATANAYIEAIAGLPDCSGMNNIANILDVLKLLIDFFTGQGLTLPDDLADLAKESWMGYRYAYSTTKADLMEGISCMQRIAELCKHAEFRSNSVIHMGDWEVRCSITLQSSELERIRSAAERWGLALDGYAIWDMIPYSFVVDWFLDIGGLLDWGRKRKAAFNSRPTEVWYSIRHDRTNRNGFREIYYNRFRWDSPLSLAAYTSHSASGRTIVKRVADALCLFT